MQETHTLADRLVKSGVRHVVAGTGAVEEKRGLVFVRSFYKAIAQGETIRVAFDTTLTTWMAEFPAEETCPFVLLPANNPNGVHDVPLFDPVDLDALLTYNNTRGVRALELALPDVPEDFCGREVDMHELLKLTKDRRHTQLVDSVPLSGFGKTALASALVRHINLRGAPFTAAVYLETLTSLPHQLLLRSLQNSLAAAGPSTRSACELIEQQLARIGTEGNVPALAAWTIREVCNLACVKRILLVVDSQAGTMPQSVIEDLREMDLPPSVHLLTVSRAPTNESIGKATLFNKTVLYHLDALSDADVANLFLRRAPREVYAADVGYTFPHAGTVQYRPGKIYAVDIARSPLLKQAGGVPSQVIQCSVTLDPARPAARTSQHRGSTREGRHSKSTLGEIAKTAMSWQQPAAG
jgi:hypothetical protein